MVWNTFGPIVTSIQYAYHWSNATVAMMANWGTITFVLFVFPLSYLLETKGLRVTMMSVVSLVALGTVLRALRTEDGLFLVLSHCGSILNGIAGAVVMSAPPALSAIWFPPDQRTTATCLSQVFTQIGTGLSFILGPYVVTTGTADSVKAEIQNYLWIQVGMAAVLLLAVILYFPKKPPSPPSASASIPRTHFKEGMKDLFTNKNALLCAFGYGFSGGTFLAWQVISLFLKKNKDIHLAQSSAQAVMTLNFQPLGVDDKQAGKIGLAICICCSIFGILVSILTDRLKKHMKVHTFFSCTNHFLIY